MYIVVITHSKKAGLHVFFADGVRIAIFLQRTFCAAQVLRNKEMQLLHSSFATVVSRQD